MIQFSADLPAGTTVRRVSELVISIGRNAANLVVLNDPTVSSSHARVSWTGSAYRLEDLGSANGIFVDGKALSEAMISCSLTFFLGTVRCLLEVCDACFVSNHESRFLMATPSVTVGRAGDNNWVLADPSVSSHHLRLFQEGEQVFVQNISHHGTRVGGLWVDEASIACGDVIQLGEATIRYARPPLLEEGFSFEPGLVDGVRSAGLFCVSGSLGRDQAGELAERLQAACTKGGKFVDLEMSACRKLHPLCLDVLLDATRSFPSAGKKLRLLAPSQAVTRAMALANAGQRLLVVGAKGKGKG
jgi:pSer/pThr/pTyr-binding forkhead associated (FHA) protein/ABC-type transporter Mla MlaB component